MFAQQLQQAVDVVDDPMPGIVFVALTVVSLVASWVWWVFLGRKRLIQDLPTSATKGVALGLNELVGTAGSPLSEASPQASVDCVWWKNEFYVEDGDNGWRKTNERQGGPLAFELTDESGTVLVRPRKAQVSAPKSYDGPYVDPVLAATDVSLVTRYLAGQTAKKKKVVERVIKAGDPVYVLGTAQLPMDSLEVYVGPDRVGHEPFLVRVGNEADALYTERFATGLACTVALASAAGAGIARADGRAIAAGGFDWATLDLWSPLISMGIVLGVLGLASLVFVYNGLVRLHHRARAAWGLIDVQLRRRHDLLPGLVETVKAHAHHEAAVQASVTQLRSSVAEELPAEPTDAAVRSADAQIRAETLALDRLLALVEAYPVLTADASFARMRAELVDTEDRVALARAFYNNSVQVLHDRAHVLPGALVAWLFGLDLEARFLDDLGGSRPVVMTSAPAPAGGPARTTSWYRGDHPSTA